MVQFSQEFNLNAGGSFVGPAATSSFLTVDFTATPTTGSQIISPDVWGSSMGAVPINNWAALQNSTFQTQMKTIPLTFYRLNSVNSVTGDSGTPALFESTFNFDGSLITWNYVDTLINTWPLCFNNFSTKPPKLILGCGNHVLTSNYSVTGYARAMQSLAQHLQQTNSNVTGHPLPVYGFEIANESQDDVPWDTYTQYFNAAATAVGNSYVLSGPAYNYFETTRFGVFLGACANTNAMVSYHNYKFGGGPANNPGGAAIIDMTVDPGQFRANNDATGCRSSISSVNSSLPIFMGEWAQDDTFGIDDTQQNYIGAVFNAQWILDGIRSNVGVQFGAIWELYQDTTYGLIQGTDTLPGGISPGGYLLSKAANNLYGIRVKDNGVQLSNTGTTLNMLSVKDPSTNRFAVMIVNFSTTNNHSGQVALSHWPYNSNGNATIPVWTIDQADPTGITSQTIVTAGLTGTITVPAASVVIITSP